MDNFYWLHQAQDSDREIVGDRGLDLSRLIHQDHPVIPGFVIPAPSFWAFLDTIDWREPFFVDLSNSDSRLHLEGSDPQHLQDIAQGIREHILTAAISPKWLSQFSEILQQWSAPAVTFQGDLSGSDLNTEGIIDPVWTAGTPTAMAEGFKQAIAEFFRARSLFYWDYWGVPLQRLQPTLLVQPLYSAVASGMIQLDSDHWQLQATPGLHLSIDWGETEPDCYQINPHTLQIQSQKQGHKLIAYRLKSTVREHLSEADREKTPQTIPLTADWAASPVVGEILPEDQQTPWVLNSTQLEALLQLTHNAQETLDRPCQLRWLLTATTPQTAEEFYWYAVEAMASAAAQAIAVTDSLSGGADYSPIPKHPLLSGLGVSGGTVIAKAVVLPGTSAMEHQFQAGSILVIPEMTTEYFPLLKQAVGVVAEQGGMTGHGAILARELGIPAIFGVDDATQLIQTREFLLIEGDRGKVHLLGMEPPTEQSLPIQSAQPINASPTPAIAIATHLMVNISQPHSIERLHNLPIDGIGLLRSELLALDVLPRQTENGTWDFQQWLQPQNRSDFVQRMAESLRLFAEAVAPKPIFYRALDLREFYQEARPFWGETHWEYIALQQRLHHSSTKTNADSITLFDLELSVLSQLYQWGYDNIHLILPLVRSIEEFSVYQYWVKQVGLTDNRNFKLWMMAEVPSVLFLLPSYIKAGVEGIAIGTNDLTQFMLGINRNNNEHLTHLNASHPAVMAAIKEMIQMAKAAGIPCSICGDAPILYPDLIQDFIQWGVNSLSVHPEAIPSTYKAIMQAEKLMTFRRQSS